MTQDLINIRAKLMVIVGQARNLDMMLGDVSCPANRVAYFDHCTSNVLKELQRMTHIVAQGVEENKNNAHVSFAG